MAVRKKSGGLPKKMKLEALSREADGKPPKISAKMPALPRPKTAKPKSAGKALRAPAARIEKFPKVGAPKAPRRKRG